MDLLEEITPALEVSHYYYKVAPGQKRSRSAELDRLLSAARRDRAKADALLANLQAYLAAVDPRHNCPEATEGLAAARRTLDLPVFNLRHERGPERTGPRNPLIAEWISCRHSLRGLGLTKESIGELYEIFFD